MVVFVSCILSLAVGLATVVSTSPTTASLMDAEQHSILLFNAFLVDLSFAVLIAFLILCHIEPTWIARNQSFPYTSQLKWNFGKEAFDFQVLTYEIFHSLFSSKLVHAIVMTCQGFLWFLIINITFGNTGLAVAFSLLAVQAISFGDFWVGLCVILTNTAFGVMSYKLLETSTISALTILNIAKVLMFWEAVAMTVNHAFEPLPPTFHPDMEGFDERFGQVAWKLCCSDLPRALWLMALGQASEIGAGCPGRYLTQVMYIIMSNFGYRSSVAISVREAMIQAQAINEGGYQAHPITAELYQWAATTCDLERDERKRLIG